MNDDSFGPPSGSDSSDAFLREVARAPDTAAPAPEPDLSGQTLGKYAVGARLGEGGMGVVYEATDSVLQRKVAVKVLSQKLLADGGARARLLREARSLAAMNHPGIAAIYEVAEIDGRVFIVMERVPGQTLRQRMAGGAMPLPECRRVVVEVARALEHAHQAGVVHRDLKPENVMLTPSGEVKILDFGLARLRAQDGEGTPQSQSSTVEGRLAGTPSYMSPEQARGAKLDGRSDLFALGAVYYELVTGQRAFRGASLIEILSAVDRDRPPPPSQSRPDLSPEHERIIYKCLEKTPELRFDSAKSLVAALESGVGAPPSRKARSLKLPLAMVGLALAASAAFMLRPLPNPLANPEALLACPPLRVTGAAEPNGWLGAAAAGLACQRAGMARWTQVQPPILPPAALLGIAPQPSEETPDDPYAAPDARERALAAAKVKGAAYLDGHVAFADSTFTVSLQLLTPEGQKLAEGSGQGRTLLRAVREAMVPLWGPGKISMPDRLPDEFRYIQSTTNPAAAVAFEDMIVSFESMTDTEDTLRRLEPYKDLVGPMWDVSKYFDQKVRGVAVAPFSVPLDRSSPEAFAFTANINVSTGGPIDAAALADELHAQIKPEQKPALRRWLTMTEARLRLAARQNDEAVNLVVASIAEHGAPDVGWFPLIMGQLGRPGLWPAARAWAAWRPYLSDVWNVASARPMTAADKKGPPLTTVFIERALLLAPDNTQLNVNLAGHYMMMGRYNDARVLGARLLNGSKVAKLSGEAVMAQVEAAEGRFQAAYDRAVRVISEIALLEYDDSLVRIGIELGRILGKPEPFAELLWTRLVQPDPPRIASGPWTIASVASACAYATPEVARACTARIDALVSSGYFRDLSPMHRALLKGSSLYAQGDYPKAAAAFRAGALESFSARTIIADAFDKSGDPLMGTRLDGPMLNFRLFNGASLAMVREVRRLWARGEKEEAKKLAKEVADAWSTADVVVPAVKEMRELMAKP